MKRTNVFTIIIFLVSTAFSYAQTSISWGPKQDEGGIFTLVGESEDLIYVSCTVVKKMGFSYEQKLLGFDKKYKKIVNEIDLKKTYGKKNMAMDMFSDGSMKLLSVNYENKKKTKIQIHQLNDSKIELVSELETLNGEYSFAPPGYENSPFFKNDKSLRLYSSPDNDYRALAKIDKKKKKETYDVKVLDPKNDYSTLHSFKLKLDNTKELKIVKDILVKDDGSAVVLIKQYNGKKDKEKKDKKPNYTFILQHHYTDGTSIDTEILPVEGFYKSTILTQDEIGNIYISALIENKHDKGAENIIIKKIDSEGKVIVDALHPSKGILKGKDKLNKYTYSTSLIYCSKDLILSISHLTDTKSKGIVFGSTEMKFEDIVVDAFNSEGNYLWSERISRNITVSSLNLFEGVHTFYNKNGVTMFMNRHKDNASETYKKKAKGVKFPTKNNVIVGISFDQNGVIKSNRLTPTGDTHVGTQGIKSIDGEIYFVGFDRRFKNLRLGVLK